MNGPTLALHGKVAATVVQLVGDPTLSWAHAAEAAEAAGDERMAHLFAGLASFAEWGQLLASTGNVVTDTDGGDLPPIDPEGTTDDRPADH